MFLEGTRSMFQNQPDVSLFYLGQERIAIEELSVLETGLETVKTQRKTTIDVSQDTCETTTARSESKSNFSPHRYFIEHLVDVFKEPPCKSNLDLENSIPLIRRLKNNTNKHLHQSTHNQDLHLAPKSREQKQRWQGRVLDTKTTSASRQ
jgi:hypothetical protein